MTYYLTSIFDDIFVTKLSILSIILAALQQAPAVRGPQLRSRGAVDGDDVADQLVDVGYMHHICAAWLTAIETRA